MKFKSIITLKKDGRVDNMASLILGLVTMFMMLMIVVFAFADMEKKSKVDNIGRNYILRMESTGYLTSSDEQALMEDLKKLGVTGISITGTTKSKVGYGESIYLKIKGKIEINTFSIAGIFDMGKKMESVDISIDKTSTAKH